MRTSGTNEGEGDEGGEGRAVDDDKDEDVEGL